MNSPLSRLKAVLENRFLPLNEPIRKDDGIEQYRASIVRFLSLLGSTCGLFMLLPEVVIGLRAGYYLHPAFALFFYLCYLALLLSSRRRARRFHSFCHVGLCLCIGLFLFADQGLVGTGPTWLFAASGVAAVLFGGLGGVAVAGLDAAIFLGLGWASSAGLLKWRADFVPFAISGLIVVCLAVVTSLSEAFLIRYLRNAISARDRLNEELEAERAALEAEAAERRGAEARASFYRDFDGLTRLLKREKFLSAFSLALPAAARRGRLLAVLVVGLDRFGRVNESYGHAVGDAVLVRAASALRGAFREDDVIGRLGNDLFAVLCTDVKRTDDVLGLIEKVYAAFERPFDLGGISVRVGASIGLALFPNDGFEAEDLLRAAEAALHVAKEAGPGSYRLFDAVFNRQLLDRLALEEELDGAISSGAIEPWYQPKVDGEGRVVGVEALARWRLPDGGLRLPDSFIPLAELSGSIVEVGRIVLERACADAAAWPRAGLPPIPVSVNLSPLQFRSPRLVEDVRRALALSGLEPGRLELEITETMIESAEGDPVARLDELKGLGVSLAIDDFGTGASSIARLRDFPVDTVKIPKAFVDPLPGDRRASTVARAVVDLAHNLEFKVVAEGVESEAQYAWLKGVDCDSFQGFLFARPLAPAAFANELARGFEARVQ